MSDNKNTKQNKTKNTKEKKKQVQVKEKHECTNQRTLSPLQNLFDEVK